MPMKLLHAATDTIDPRIWTPDFQRMLAEIGELEILEHASELDTEALLARLRRADVLLGGWKCIRLPEALAEDWGRVRYCCCVTGGVRGFVTERHIQSGMPVTNWGDTSAIPIAEGAMCLLLATVKGIHDVIISVRDGGGPDTPLRAGGSLSEMTVGIFGFGVIGRRFAELLRPFGPRMLVFDPYVENMPDGIEKAESLEALFRSSQAVVIHAGLTDETRGAVTAELLSLLPRHGILINTARGDIVDQAALFRELESGRLRAGLDVLAEPEVLPADHPARRWPNLIWTCHDIDRLWPRGEGAAPLTRMHQVCLENLRRFEKGEPVQFLMDLRRFRLST